MIIQNVKYILLAQDMDRAVRFYRDFIGLRVRTESPFWSELTHGDAIVALHGGHDGSPNKTGLSVQVADIEVACREATVGGARITYGPEARPGEPIKLADLVDTEGNKFSFSEFIGR